MMMSIYTLGCIYYMVMTRNIAARDFIQDARLAREREEKYNKIYDTTFGY